MEKNDLVNLITQKVMERMGSKSGGSGSSSSGACCSVCGSEHDWDGVGTVGDMLEAGASRLSTGGSLGSCPDPALARLIDHTLLKADATANDVTALCKEAADNCFMSVCVNPSWVALAAKELRGTGVKVCTVVGFPLGATPSRVKELETRVAIDDGASEIDMVINIGALKSGHHDVVFKDIQAVVRATRGNVISKVILENCYLTAEEIKVASELSAKAGANFVKTSTGFGTGGAKPDDLRIMRETVGDTMGVKASGGIRDHETAMTMVMAGASRIGASASVAIVNCDDGAGAGKY